MTRISLALLGAGRIGRTHAATIVAVEGAQLSAVHDPVRENAADVARLTGARVADVHDIMNDPQIDGVIIATPTDHHAGQIEQAASSGKAIFCEKPIDLDRCRAETAVARAEDLGAVLMVGFNRRFDPSFQRLREVVANDGIGTAETVIVTSRDPCPPPIEYVRRSGGLFRDMMIHDFDMVRFLLSEPVVSVFAHGASLVDPAIAKVNDIDTATATLTTASGALAVITNSRRATYGYDQRIEVHGSKGMVHAGNPAKTSVSIASSGGLTSDAISDFFMDRYADAYRIELQTFCTLIRGDEEVDYPAGRDGVEALRLADAAVLSLASRSVVDVTSV